MTPTPDSTHDTTNRYSTPSRRRFLQSGAATAAAAGLAGCVSSLIGGGSGNFQLGVVLPFSQGWKPFGQPIRNTLEISVGRINDDGGLAGREVELLFEDSQATPKTAVEKTTQLVEEDQVDVIFGPVTSASRNAMAPVLKENQVPGLYAIDYEGPAAKDYCNEYLFKFGEVPPQQIEPFVPWLMEEYGTSFFLIGTDYIWPQTMNQLIRGIVEDGGGSVLGETYVPFGTTDFSSIISKIENEDPDVLFMTLTGATAIAMSKQMANRGVRDQWQDVGLAHVQTIVNGIPTEGVEGLINCRDYFSTLQNSVNQDYLDEYYETYGENTTVTTHAGLTFMAMQMLETAVSEAGAATSDDLLSSLPGVTVDSPMGQRTMGHDHQANHACTVAEVSSEKTWSPLTKFDAVMPDETCDSF